MASYHFSSKVGSKGKGASHAQYIFRHGKYTKKSSDLENCGYGNMPAWAKSPLHFWRAVDQNERKNGSSYKEYEFALPRELPPAKRLELVLKLIKTEICDRFTYSYALHNPKSKNDGMEQPHCHLMFCERELDTIDRDEVSHFKRFNASKPAEGGCKKPRGSTTLADQKAELVALRGRFADLQNSYLTAAGTPDRVDHRSFKDRGIDAVPGEHFGQKALGFEVRAGQVSRRRIHANKKRYKNVVKRCFPSPKINNTYKTWRGSTNSLRELRARSLAVFGTPETYLINIASPEAAASDFLQSYGVAPE